MIRPAPRLILPTPTLLALALLLSGCAPSYPPPSYPTSTGRAPAAPSQAVPGPPIRTIQNEPVIRVRLKHLARRVTLDAAGPVLVAPGSSGVNARPRRFAPPITITHDGRGFVIANGRGQSVRWALPSMRVLPTDRSGRGLTMAGNAYPGAMFIVPTKQTPGRFDVVNHLGLETYLPGVLQGELFPGWEPVTFRAQAVVARSYALWEMNRDRSRGYDLTAGTASQVYGGHASAKAVAAVRATRGRVLAYRGRVVPAFFSSTCGGIAQDAAAVFAAKTPPIKPLSGHAPASYCQGSKRYRWGPVRRDTRAAAQRIAAWGKAQGNPVANLRAIGDLRVSRRSSTGRPSRFTVTDAATGRRYTLRAEDMRFALNQAAPGLPKLSDKQRVYSSQFRPGVRGHTLTITGGRGWGHGVGMCQWGAHGMIQQGYSPGQVLGFYYPGAAVRRLY